MATDRRQAVVFDLGGVLIDWNPRYLYRQLFDDEAAMEHFLAHVCTPEWNLEQDRGRPLAEGVSALQREHPDQAELIAAYYSRWPEMLRDQLHDSVAVFEELGEAGIRLFGLTNFSAETYPLAVERFAFFERFEAVIVSGREGLLKPDERIYRLLLERHGIAAATTVFIDDIERNVEGARATGIDGIHFTGAAALRMELVARGLLA